jgi:hypothetical protein
MTKGAKKESSSITGVERRRFQRRPVLETFSVFVVIPKKGIHRLELHDISEIGMGFDLDIEGEEPAAFPVREGEAIDLRFYLNQSLYIPLSIQITRIEDHHQKRRVGGEFQDKSTQGYQAFLSFLHLIDKIVDVVQIDEDSSSKV